jgi:hypothetical protein
MTRKAALTAGVKPTITIVVLLAGAALLVLGVRRILRPLVLAMFGPDLGKSSLFDLALISFSLIVYLFGIVCAMRIWEESLRGRLKERLSKQRQLVKKS